MEIIENGLSVPERSPDGLSASLAGNDAEAIMLDLVQPIAAGRQLVGFGWEAHFARQGRVRLDDLRTAEVGTSEQRNHSRGRDGRCGSPLYPLLVRAGLSVPQALDILAEQ